MKRRKFIQFLGGGMATLQLQGVAVFLSSCSHSGAKKLMGLPPSKLDQVELFPGLSHEIVATWGDAINTSETFGFNNDYLAFQKRNNQDFLWVNHETVKPLFATGWTKDKPRIKKDVDLEQKEVGGSFIRIENKNGKWSMVKDSQNFRLDGKSKIPFAWPEPIQGSKVAIGTLANCGGGQTPWGTVLTCEENFDSFYGKKSHRMKWDQFYNHPEEHYGWVVEVDTKKKTAKKLVSLGRFAHESATVHEMPDGRLAVYSGDDANDEFLYKFISEKPGSLDSGELFVADFEKGLWMSLDIKKQPILQKKFKSQTEIQIQTRKAGKLLGATPLDRPEDIQIDPLTGNIIVAATNNKPKGNYHGQILKLAPRNADHMSPYFEHDTFIAGGEETGFASPDNLQFDKLGNLWFTTDISEKDMDKPEYKNFGNNSLFVVPRSGKLAGQAVRLANAPVDAEFTGPCFNETQDTLFLAVQHPGNSTKKRGEYTSHWPNGGNSMPRSAVIAIKGFDVLKKSDIPV